MNALFIGLGGIIGMTFRYFLTDKFSSFSFVHIISITMLINLLSCFLIGLLLSSSMDSTTQIFSQSFISAFSTYSTFNYELLKNIIINKFQGILYLILTCLLSFLFFYLGIIV